MTTPIEAAERARRELVSAVKRLRASATSDPARGVELADALVQLTGTRLLAWDYVEAAGDAPEAVLLAARILARNGAAGPYTSPTDAARFFTASALLAAVQSGLGQAEAAARTLSGIDGWLEQLGRLPLREHLEVTAVIWSLLARSRALLAVDLPRANAFADAAAHRLYAAGLESAPGYQAVAVHLLLADCRWLAGHAEEALAHHRLALACHRAVVGSAGIGRVRPGVAQVIEAPVVALHEPYALRLESIGDTELATAVRRAEVALLASVETATAPGRLAVARAELARTLARAGRAEEAAAEAARATALVAAVGIGVPPESRDPGPGERCDWPALPAAESLAPDDSEEAGARLQQDVAAAVRDGATARAAAKAAENHLRAESEAAAAAQAAEQAEAEKAARRAAAVAAAARAELDRKEAEQAATRRRSAEEASRAAADQRRRERAAEHRQPAIDAATATAAAAELAAAREAVQAAGQDLDRQRLARESLAGLLRPLAALDPDVHRPELVAALESLVGLRWRSGDPEGSREAAREARALAAEATR